MRSLKLIRSELKVFYPEANDNVAGNGCEESRAYHMF
jgi:hypothetical protein